MRFLCLHGLGTSSSIFEAQTARIREQLGASFEFVFLDGEYESAPAEGVSAIYPGPYLGWYPAFPSEPELSAARELVLEVLREDGPFDGLMGFSQGAALAASLILRHAAEHHGRPLVDCAVFICGTAPWMLHSDLMSFQGKPNPAYQIDMAASDAEDNKIQQQQQQEHLRAVKDGVVTAGSAHGKWISNGGHQEGSAMKQGQACLLRPASSTIRFPIPTAYIHGGRKDKYFELSEALIGLGDEAHGVRVYSHEAGHVIPRGEFDTGKMVETITWAAEKVILRI